MTERLHNNLDLTTQYMVTGLPGDSVVKNLPAKQES